MSVQQTIKVMLDTNVRISAVYNSSSTTFQAFRKGSEPPYVLVPCDQVIDELRRIFNRKFPTKIQAMERFLSIAHYDLVTLTAEDAPSADEPDIRDINDRPILRSALKAGVEILVTGDKDFIESSVKTPKSQTYQAIRRFMRIFFSGFAGFFGAKK